MVRFTLKLTAVVMMMAGVAGCTVHKQGTPDLTGPSELGKSITITVNPDVLPQDGQSQSLVTIVARDANGQPLRNLPLRADVAVSGAVTSALGSLSARSLVTDASGQASVVYTAPDLPLGLSAPAGTIQILVTPSEGDFGNSVSRSANIRLVVPPGVGVGPTSPLRPDFVAPSVAAGDPAVFSATVVDAAGADASAQVNSFLWDFGDGDTASGRNVQHTFGSAGNFGVTLTITDTAGRQAQAFHTATVSAGSNPSATIVASPGSPNIGQSVTFTATGVVVQPGHHITSYRWDFGDGSRGSGASVSHAYLQQGSFTVVLTVTDDTGRIGTATQSISVGTGGTTASFTSSPSNPIVGQTINFNASASTPAPGRTIVSYAWDFGDGTTGSGQTTTHAFQAVGTFTVTLTVTDSAGQRAFATNPITVANDTPTARFTFAPATPTVPVGQTTTSVAFDANTSTAAPGRTIVSYQWLFGDGSVGSGATTSHVYARGTFTVVLTVTDNAGKQNTTSQTITVQ